MYHFAGMVGNDLFSPHILRLIAVHAVIDCDKAYLLFGEQNLGIKADFKIVSTETAHILDDNCADFAGFGFCKHCLKSGTVKVTPCIAVIGKMLDAFIYLKNRMKRSIIVEKCVFSVEGLCCFA